MLKIWKGHFGNRLLKDIEQKDVEDFLNVRMDSGGVSASTRNRDLAMLKSMFNRGIKWKHMEENSAVGIEMLRELKGRTRFLTQEEIGELLDAASEWFRRILLLAIHTGMRRAEILKLKWTDVDFPNRIISVADTKTGEPRDILMTDTLYETLRTHPSRFQRRYVFPSPVNAGEPMVDLNQTFRRLVNKVGLEDLRFHDLRHTFASHLVMSGVDIKTVQELLGHANLPMTMRYANLSQDHRTRSVKTLDTALRTDTKTAHQPKEGSSGRSKLLK